MTFDDLIRYKALHLKYVSSNSDLLDLSLIHISEPTRPY